MAVLLLITGPSIIPYWTKNSINVPRSLSVAYVAWTIVEAAGAVLGTYLNGVGIVREKVIVVFCFCLVAYLLTVVGLYSTVFRNHIIARMRYRPHGE